MTKKITIPQQNQPFRRQSSLGGNVSFRNLGGTDNNNYVVMAVVTKVYYKQGRVDFKLTNSTNHVVTETGDGMGSAPIPVDFYGYQRDGKIFGHYRPIQIGDLIAVAYLWGHKQAPIVLGVYPKDSSSYEFVAPQEASSFGDDRDEATYDYALGDQKIFPDGSLEYHSGNGKYFKTLRGKSFMLLDDSPLYEHLWVGYNDIGAFKDSDQNTINPLQEDAGDWLLVHEDNNEGSNSTDHRTRFYVNKDGTFQVVLSKSSKLDNLVILEGSKSNGFTLQQLYNVPQKGWISEKDPHKEPDIKNAQQYVKFNIGGSDRSATIEAATKDDSVEQATKLEIKDDGIYVNDKPLISSNPKYAGKTIIDDTISNSDGLNDAIKKAQDAAEQAKQAGEIAKAAGVAAEAAGDDAKKTGDGIKKRIIYYASVSKEKDIAIPGKYIIINTDTYIAKGTIKNAYIEDGAIDNAKIANGAIDSAQIKNGAITNAKIADLAVGTAQIEDAAITDAKIGSLSADKITTGTLDADKIKVVNLTAANIKAGSITADSLKIGKLSDITGDAGQITDGKIIVKGNGSNSGVSLEGLDADNPNVYTPSKKAALANIVHAIESSAEASLDYAKQVGLSNDPVAEDLQTKYDNMVDGLALIFNHMDVSTNFDHNTVEQLTSDCNNAIDKFQNLANSQLNRKIGQTADNKNSVYQGYEQPANPHINDIWFQENSDGTYQIRVYDGGSWISPGMQDIKEVQESVSTLPRSYYSYTQPTGTDYKDGDIWYKTSTDITNNTVVYTPFKWDSNNNTWDPMLDATSSHNYVGSAPVNPINGDFWMDNTTLKQYQNGVWKTIPTQGPQGVPGVSAKQQYIHIAYATSANGTENFSNSTFSGATYIGLLIDFNEEDSSDPTKYNWSLIKGKDGTDGKDGVPGKPGIDGKTPYLHIAYADSSDGKTNFSTNTPGNRKYIGSYTDFTQADSTNPALYSWQLVQGPKGDKGDQGIPGAKGADGKTYYTWIKYATDSSGSNISDSPTGMSYIGIAYNKGSQTESSVPTDYKWTKIKGDQGIQGPQGTDGKTPYVHIAYANSADGSGDSFTTDGTKASQATINNDPYQYMGTYVDYNQTSSQDHTMYKWTMIYDKSKKRNFTDQPTTPYNVGDTWTDRGATYFCTRDKLTGAFNASDWTMQQLTIHSLAPSVTNSLYNDNLVIGTSQDIVVDDTANTGTQGWRCYTIPINADLKVGDKITVSVENVTMTGKGDLSKWGATLYSTDISEVRAYGYEVNAGKNAQVTITVNSMKDPNKKTALLIYSGRVSDTEGKKAVFHHLKVERGTVATPWCLSQSELTTTTGNYKGVTLNDAGLTATAGSTTVAMNSNDGFLIKKKAGGEVFHVDTNGNLALKGDINAGHFPNSTISGVNFTGKNLTLTGLLEVSGSISTNNGNVVISSNGITVKDGGLKIVNGENETTTEIRDDGTFATDKGYFNGEVHTNKLILNGKDSDINMGGGIFHVDSNGKVTARSITITGGTIDAGNTKFENFSANYITAGILKSVQIDNGNGTFHVDPDGDVTAKSITLRSGKFIQGTIVGSKIYALDNDGSQDPKLAPKSDWYKITPNMIRWFNHYDQSVGQIGVGQGVLVNSGGPSEFTGTPGLTISDSAKILLGTAQRTVVTGDEIGNLETTGLDWMSRTNLDIKTDGLQVNLDPDQGNEYDGKGAQFVIQKDNKIGAYFGSGDHGNELSITTTGDNNHITFNTGLFSVYGEVHIPDHGLTVKDLHVTHWLGVDKYKNSIVNTSQGTVAINAYETAEYYFGDIGEGQTNSNGIAYIGIEKLFNETVNTNIPYQVFLTAYGPGDIWVAQREHNRFIVKSNQPNIKFGWEIKAKRKGYEHNRLQNVDNMIEKPAGIK